MRRHALLSVISLLLPTVAQSRIGAADMRPGAFKTLLDCRNIPETAKRLACFDSAATALDAAQSKRDIIVVDKEQITNTRRQLFGFSLPSLEIFGDHSSGNVRKDADSDEISEINSTVQSLTKNSDGGWVATLDGGARWSQTDSTVLGREPRNGMAVTIKRAALGSYKMSFAGGPAVRAKRIN